MNWIERMRSAMEFIEENILEDLDSDSIALVADTTSFHFQRMFSIIMNISLGEYIRHRRLTLAAHEIMSSDIPIIDVALKYGYETHASFTKAFTKMHGIAPIYARQPGINIKAYPPITFNLSIQGDTSMDYKIREFKKTRMVGKTIEVSTANGENMKIIPKFWDDLVRQKALEEITALADKKGQFQGSLVGACMSFDDNAENFTYMIGVESNETNIPDGMIEANFDSQKYAVFEARGPQPEAIQKTWRRIFSEWFPATKFIHAKKAEFEVYNGESECTHCDIWIPIESDKKM
ncbi:MAG: AraC family transcriptional regulator [Spirochaetes bacterium]|nr:AraC family transcriptional regulator [Spirochaetota bacterium]